MTTVVRRPARLLPVLVLAAAGLLAAGPADAVEDEESAALPVAGTFSYSLGGDDTRPLVRGAVHAVRRVPGGTAVYYSLGVPAGDSWTSTASMPVVSLQEDYASGDAAAVALVDPVGLRYYQPLVGPDGCLCPKVYELGRDSGVLHALLGIATVQDLQGHPIAGASWEGFVVEQVAAALPAGAQMGFYRTAIAQDPRDRLAVAGLAQVSLLHRLTGSTPDSVGAAAASAPGDVTAELAAADLDMSGGRVDDAFARLLDLFAGLDADNKNQVRTRLLDYFEIAGADDPRVTAARRRLTMLLY